MSDRKDDLYLQELASKWLDGTISAEEKAYYNQWYGSFDDSELLVEGIPSSFEAKGDKMLQFIHRYGKMNTHRLWPFFLKVAAVLVVTFTLCYTAYQLSRKEKPVSMAAQIVPGTNQATLTLSNGKMIALRNQADGLLAVDGQTDITKTSRGDLNYHNGANSSSVGLNTLHTPKGGQYTVILADGTKVMLNAQSTLSYPTNFDPEQRLVTLTGEAYFEVAHDRKRPFKVVTAAQTISVLGTHFNVMAYADDETTRTTLAQGSVKVDAGGNGYVLLPRQQAVYHKESKQLQTQWVDVDQALAWKDGFFAFERENIFSVMRKISRWYDVDIRYQGHFENVYFSGNLSRFSSIQDVLNTLSLTNMVNFKIEGRRVLVIR